MRTLPLLFVLSAVACGESPTARGVVTIDQLCLGAIPCFTSGNAYFLDEPATADRCTRSEAGGCLLVDCASNVASSNTGTRLLSAGRISVSDRQGPLVELEYAGRAYRTAQVTERPWSPGDVLTVTAGGDTVPSFSATVTVPEASTLTAPMCVRSQVGWPDCGPASRASDLVVRWEGPSGARFGIDAHGSGRVAAIFCDADSSPAVVPAELLSQLPGEANFWFTPQNRATVAAGDWNVGVAIGIASSQQGGKLQLGQ